MENIMFKKLALKVFGNLFRKQLIKQLADDEFRDSIIAQLNAKLDIPKLTEDQEKKHLESIWEVTEEILIDILNDIS